MLENATKDKVELQYLLSTKVAADSLTKTRDVDKDSETKFKCDQCNYETKSESELKGHKKFEHNRCNV